MTYAVVEEDIRPVLVRSNSASLRIDIPRELAMGLNIDGKKTAFPSLKLTQGQIEVTNSLILEALQKHTGNEINGGNEFWIEDRSVTKAAKEATGEKKVVNYTLTNEDKLGLENLTLIENAAKEFDKDELARGVEWVFKRFEIDDIPQPRKNAVEKKLSAALTLAFSWLEEKNIWPEKK